MMAETRSRSVFLVGFMGAGKSTVGREVARRLGRSFLDLDEVIERRQGSTVAAIFAEAGEPGFRKFERAALEELLGRHWGERGDELVVALGGGAFSQPGNRQILERAGAVTILLEAPLEELRRRCRQDSTIRPLAQDECRFAQLFAERQAAYAHARFRVQTMHKAVEEVAADIEKILGEDAGN